VRSTLSLFILIIEEVHVNGVPTKSSDSGNTISIFKLVVILTSLTVSVGKLLSASSHIGHTNTLSREEVRSTKRTKTIRVNLTLRISKLTLSKVIKEIESVTIDADTCLIKERAVLISILASSLGVYSISLYASNTGSSIWVVFLTILIL
jgi:hypothetical protein